MYEPRHHAPIADRQFYGRVARHALVAFGLMAVSLLVGMAGYARYERLAWRDAFLNAAMLLGGMGPVDPPRTDDGKLFAGLYALYAGFIFVAASGILLAPVGHRILHTFHWKDEPS